MGYRAAAPDSIVILACSPLLARRALLPALVSALAAATGYAVSGRGLLIAVLGGGLALTTVVGLLAQRALTEERGWLDVRCMSTCRLQGMTCLEGGRLSAAFEAGEAVVEIADPAAPGGFRPVAIPIRVGRRTSFECLPDARAPTSVPE